MSEELKPCPFCGSKADPHQFTHKHWSVDCSACGAAMISGSTKRDAIENWNTRAQAAPEAEPVADDLDSRMRAAGMLTTADLLAGAPLDAFVKHAGVTDLDTFGQWLETRRKECLDMHARFELDKRKDDELYEWVIAHAAVFSEVHVNFKAAAPQHDAELVELLDDLASALECEVNARYAGSQTHPALARKYEGDMDEVRRARAKLATLRDV